MSQASTRTNVGLAQFIRSMTGIGASGASQH
jgi:hypothetical protein